MAPNIGGIITELTEEEESLLQKVPEEDPGQKKLTLLYDGYYYDVTSFASRHPGGDIIQMYLNNGEDATHAIQQFHYRSTKRIQAMLNSFPKRKATEDELVMTQGSEKLKRNRELTADFLELFKELKEEGLFEPCYSYVFMRYMELLILTIVGHFLNENGYVLPGLACITWCCCRAGWFVHESGHHSFTGNPKFERFIQSHVYGVVAGLSASCWRNHHSRHHAMPQHVKNDVDLDTLPIMAFHAKMVKNPNSQFNFLVKYQKYIVYMVQSTIVGIYWKYWEDPIYAWKHGQYMDLCNMAFHQVFVYVLGIKVYFVIGVIVFSYLGLNTTLSHTHLEVTEEPTHWVEYGLVHSSNVRSSWWVDYFMGYLNYQIEHHLFPTMPQFRNKLASKRVKALAKKHNLPYYLFDFKTIVMKTINNLGNVSDEIAASLEKID